MGFERVDAPSYSTPKVVPQFADASELLAMLPRRAGVWYKATCANARAVQRALADQDAGIGANEISLLVSASASHSLRNLKRERAAQWENIAEMAGLANGRLRMVGTISGGSRSWAWASSRWATPPAWQRLRLCATCIAAWQARFPN
ncbi:hypothetical protein G6F31_018842 [Rhizopus arrhizus]|nr:hypothetical protein G6F31_018842 [Rhizopus arrhizus]